MPPRMANCRVHKQVTVLNPRSANCPNIPVYVDRFGLFDRMSGLAPFGQDDLFKQGFGYVTTTLRFPPAAMRLQRFRAQHDVAAVSVNGNSFIRKGGSRKYRERR